MLIVNKKNIIFQLSIIIIKSPRYLLLNKFLLINNDSTISGWSVFTQNIGGIDFFYKPKNFKGL